MLRCFALLAVLVFHPVALLAAACPGPDNPTFLWKGVPPNHVPVTFNTELDPRLEQVRVDANDDPLHELGDDSTREEAFAEAVKQWNLGIHARCGNNTLTLTPVSLADDEWGPDQGMLQCVDGGLPPHQAAEIESVFLSKNVAPPNGHFGDNKNVTSTGHDHPAEPTFEAGWIVGESIASMDIDKRLAETVPKGAAMTYQEADITMFTHFKQDPMCPRIPWDYRLNKDDAADPAVPYPGGLAKNPDPAAFDYHSVVMHELGHLIGLGHLIPQNFQNNVMLPVIDAGVRRKITASELNCVQELYCKQIFACAPLGDEETGCMPPTGTIAKCEGKLALTGSKLLVSLIKCQRKRGKGSLADEAALDTCEAAALAKFDAKAATLSGCESCTAANLTTIKESTGAFADLANGLFYCTGSAPFGADEIGFLPPDSASGKCSDKLFGAAATLAKGLGKCHFKRGKGALADDAALDACEAAAQAKFDQKATKLGGCPPCADLAEIKAAIDGQLDGTNQYLYCASPSGAFVDGMLDW